MEAFEVANNFQKLHFDIVQGHFQVREWLRKLLGLRYSLQEVLKLLCLFSQVFKLPCPSWHAVELAFILRLLFMLSAGVLIS